MRHRQGHSVQNVLQKIVTRNTIGLRIKVKDQSMPHGGYHNGVKVIKRDLSSAGP